MASNRVKGDGRHLTSLKQNGNVSKAVAQVEKTLIALTIKEPFSPEVEEFDTPSSFREYLTEHVDEMKTLTTYKLNKKFKVEGYRITKITGEIGLQKIRIPSHRGANGLNGGDDETNGAHTLDSENRFADLETRFNEMDTRQEEIEHKIGEIIRCLEVLKNQLMCSNNPSGPGIPPPVIVQSNSGPPPPPPSPAPSQMSMGPPMMLPSHPLPIHPPMNMNMSMNGSIREMNSLGGNGVPNGPRPQSVSMSMPITHGPSPMNGNGHR
jgi:hypothetical protein